MKNPFSFPKRKPSDIFAPSKEAQIQNLQNQLEESGKQIADVQNQLSILLGPSSDITVTTGNPYCSYEKAVLELSKAYEGLAQWGVQQVRNIIDVRSAFTIGNGIKLVSDEKDSRELKFIEEFVKYNNLNEEMPQELAKEAELDGKCLVKLVDIPEYQSNAYKEIRNMVSFRFLDYSCYKYKVNADPADYQKYNSVEYTEPGTSKNIVLKDGEFVYKRFCGRLGKVNEVIPKVAMVLRHCQDIDKALADWRKINYLFGSPTPYFKCLDSTAADNLYKKLREINWKIGKFFVGTAEFSFVGPPPGSMDSIMKEIESLAKIVSGATGVPVHFLGFVDLMSNRSTSTDLFEMINASCNKERHLWKGYYEELFNRAIVRYNALAKSNLRTGTVSAEIVIFTEAQLRLLAEVYLPLYTAQVIDLDYMLSKIPDADPEKVRKSLDSEAKKLLDSIKLQEKNAAGQSGGAGQ